MIPLPSVSSAIAILLQAAPSALDVQRLEKYSTGWTDSNAPRLEQHARVESGGHGVEFANHFLTHADPRPRRVLARFRADPDPEIRTAAGSALDRSEPSTAAVTRDGSQ